MSAISRMREAGTAVTEVARAALFMMASACTAEEGPAIPIWVGTPCAPDWLPDHEETFRIR